MSVTLCDICSHPGTDSDHQTTISQLQKILPCEFNHILCSHEPLNGNNFSSNFRLKLTTEKEANKWLQAFQDSSFVTWRKLKTYPDAGRFNAYRVDLRCQHFSRPKAGTTRKKEGKDTQCPARMYLVVKRSQISRNRKSRSRDEHIHKGFMFIVNLRNDHNHDLLGPASLSKRDVCKETTDTLKELYQKGHTPSSALGTLKYNLQEEFGDNYTHVLGDRSVCPDLQYCYRLYYNLAKQANGTDTGEDVYVNLEARLLSYNEEHDDECAKMRQTEDGEVVVAICTPLMKRVHVNMEYCGQMIFVDSSANTDKDNCYLFVLLAHSPIGGLPLGVIVTTSETESTVITALELLKSLLPEGAFGGQGCSGPQVAITYDCVSLRQAIYTVYPTTELILCEFPLLQTTWRWLWDDGNGISPKDRPGLLATVTAMVHSNSIPQLDERYACASGDDIAKQYGVFQVHLAEVYMKRKTWSKCCQDQLLVLPDTTIELSTAAMLVFKDKILYKMKTDTFSQSVGFVMRQFDTSYKRRLSEVANKGTSNLLNSKYLPLGRDLNCKAIVQVDTSHYTIPSISSQQEHLINMEIGTCTCPVGMRGGPCKHQHAIIKKLKVPGYLFSTVSPYHKKMFGVIATGKPLLDVIVESTESSPVCDITSVPVESVEMTIAQEIIAAATNIQDLKTNSIQEQDSHGVPCLKDHSYDTQGFQITSQQKQTTAPLDQRLKRMLDTINDKIKSDPTVYKAAAKSFVTSFESLETDSALVSALYTFGKSSGEAMSAAKRHKLVARKSLQNASQLGEQSTSTEKDS